VNKWDKLDIVIVAISVTIIVTLIIVGVAQNMAGMVR
jgi:hypothetical protein